MTPKNDIFWKWSTRVLATVLTLILSVWINSIHAEQRRIVTDQQKHDEEYHEFREEFVELKGDVKQIKGDVSEIKDILIKERR